MFSNTTTDTSHQTVGSMFSIWNLSGTGDCSDPKFIGEMMPCDSLGQVIKRIQLPPASLFLRSSFWAPSHHTMRKPKSAHGESSPRGPGQKS